MRLPKISSDFAILDVKRGRKALLRHFGKAAPAGVCRGGSPIPVTITGYIDCAHSDDDGTSVEFSVLVEGVKLGVSDV